MSRKNTFRAVCATVTMALTFPAVSGVIFQDGFESGDTSHTQSGARWSSSVRSAVVSANPKSGSRSLELSYEGVANGQDSFTEQRFELGKNYPELWVSYDIFVPSNYKHRSQSSTTNNKGFLYLWSGNYGSPNGPGMGPNLWPNGDGSSNHSFYVWGPGLDQHLWHDESEAILLSDRGKWIQVISHYKYASSARNDGVAEIWKKYSDGTTKKIQNVQNGNWYVAGQRGFDTGYILGWSNSGFDQQTKFYIDNVVMSTTSLLNGTASTPTSEEPAASKALPPELRVTN